MGLSAAVLIARASEGVAEATAYAEEGIIHQHLAQKALDIFKTRLTSLQSYPCRKDNLIYIYHTGILDGMPYS